MPEEIEKIEKEVAAPVRGVQIPTKKLGASLPYYESKKEDSTQRKTESTENYEGMKVEVAIKNSVKKAYGKYEALPEGDDWNDYVKDEGLTEEEEKAIQDYFESKKVMKAEYERASKEKEAIQKKYDAEVG